MKRPSLTQKFYGADSVIFEKPQDFKDMDALKTQVNQWSNSTYHIFGIDQVRT